MENHLEFIPEFDVHGPLNLGLALESTGVATGSRAVIFGDSDFGSNRLLEYQGNLDLVVNSFNWLSGQEKLVAIGPKVIMIPRIVLNGDQKQMIFFISVIISPLLVLMIGGAIWLTRRRV